MTWNRIENSLPAGGQEVLVYDVNGNFTIGVYADGEWYCSPAYSEDDSIEGLVVAWTEIPAIDL